MPEPGVVRAAGAVVYRPGRQVLLVHRPRYDDWSFPKGKLDPGEHPAVAAVREVAEETGVHVRLGPPLPSQQYVSSGRPKTVDYWVGWPVGKDDVSDYLVNHEIDEVVWLPYDEAKERLTYPHDRETLHRSRALRKKTRALIVLRHAAARSRRSWRSDDRLRPLLKVGHDQAQRLVALLAAYDATRLVSSSSTRCVQTLAPYADTTGWPMEKTSALTEEDATAGAVMKIVDDLLECGEGAVICTHRKVLPTVLDALRAADPELEKGGQLVVHHRKGKVLATELHQKP